MHVFCVFLHVQTQEALRRKPSILHARGPWASEGTECFLQRAEAELKLLNLILYLFLIKGLDQLFLQLLPLLLPLNTSS